MAEQKKCKLASGTQVREEDFGLLFYTMQGPRLYFLTCGSLLESGFFRGEAGLGDWLKGKCLSEARALSLKSSLDQLEAKGVQFLEFNQKDWEAMLSEARDSWEAGKALLTDEFKVDPALANHFINRWHELNDEYASKYMATGKQWRYE
jgi:putative mycofactocin binding protein MftB